MNVIIQVELREFKSIIYLNIEVFFHKLYIIQLVQNAIFVLLIN